MAQPTPTTTADNAADAVIKEDNDYVMVVKKRLRNYKKKIANILKIEAKVANNEKIIKEQEEALRTKDSVTKIIQELENIEASLLEVKQSEQQKQFSLDDVKVLISLIQTPQGHVKKVEGVTDQQMKHLQSSANSLLRPSSKWSADDTVKHALKLVRDPSLKSTIAKVSTVSEESKQEIVEEKTRAPEPAVPVPTPVVVETVPATTVTAPVATATTAPVQQSAEAPATAVAPAQGEEGEDHKEKGFQRKGGFNRGRRGGRGGSNGTERTERTERTDRAERGERTDRPPRSHNPRPRGAAKPQATTATATN